MLFKYTKHQVARGARADGEAQSKLILVKNVSALRATYQIRLLAFRAVEEGKVLFIHVPRNCKIRRDLKELIRNSGRRVRLERIK